MIFTTPTPFAEAVEHSAVKVLLPTSLDSAEAAEHLDAEILERARFSSQIVNAEILDELGQGVDELIAGTSDLVTRRNILRAKAKALGYQPEPGKEGTIQDFTSIRRLNIALLTPVQMAQGYGQFMQGQDPAVLDLYPAQELYRAQARKVPRNWNARWSDAASRTRTPVSGFVALKNTDIWTAISRFHTPYSPFDFNSGMRTRAVARARAVALGLIDRDTQIIPQSRDFNRDLAVTPEIRDERLRAAITEGNPRVRFDAAGTLHLIPNREAAGNESAALRVVQTYDPADPSTWEVADDESASLGCYLQALFNPDAEPLQAAA